MNLKEIKEIINMMKEHALSEIEIEKQGLKIKLKKNNGNIVVQDAAPVVQQTVAAPAAQAQLPLEGGAPAAPAANETIVCSPMVGTFYATPSPDQPAYVSMGSNIQSGDVLCIVEAMKLMNEIKSEVSGKVIEILVEPGTSVEFDQPLFRVQTG